MRPAKSVGSPDGTAVRTASFAFVRHLSFAVVGVVVLMAATLAGAVWMAAQQDRAAQESARRVVEGSIEAMVERLGSMVLDYAIWTAAYDHALQVDRPWLSENIGASVEIDTFDAALMMLPDGIAIGWDGTDGPHPDVFDPEAVATADRLLDAVPVDSGTAGTAFLRSGGLTWLVAIARVVPQDGVPPGLRDADLPRLMIGLQVSDALVAEIGTRFGLSALTVAIEPAAGASSVALLAPDGRAVARVDWQPPTPGRAALRALLWPLVGLMAAVTAIVLLVSRELVRTARRLELALAQAQAADRTKTEFLSNVSHELRTPLNGVIGVAQLLQMREQEPEARRMLEILLASAHSQLQLVNGLLDISRIESGAMTLAEQPFDPASVVEDVLRLLGPDIEAKGLALRVDVATDARGLRLGDPMALRQIATNLVGNAIKFTDRGSIAVGLSTDRDGALVLSVEDTGVGIPPAEHERIFERFVQVDSAATRVAGGTGLGLAITRALVDLQRGSIGVRSAPGRGAVFTVVLPLPAPRAIAA